MFTVLTIEVFILVIDFHGKIAWLYLYHLKLKCSGGHA